MAIKLLKDSTQTTSKIKLLKNIEQTKTVKPVSDDIKNAMRSIVQTKIKEANQLKVVEPSPTPSLSVAKPQAQPNLTVAKPQAQPDLKVMDNKTQVLENVKSAMRQVVNGKKDTMKVVGAEPTVTKTKTSFLDKTLNVLSKVPVVSSLDKGGTFVGEQFAKAVTEKTPKGFEKVTTLETLKGFEQGLEGLEQGVKSFVMEQLPKTALILTKAALENTPQPVWEFDKKVKEKAKNTVNTFINILDNKTRKRIEKLGINEKSGMLDPAKFGFGITSGGSSMGLAIGVGLITKSPNAAAALLSAVESSDTYQNAREAGKNPQQALAIAGAEGIGTYYLEKLGMESMFKTYAGGRIANAAIKSITETLQESSQTVWQNLVAKVGYDKARPIFSNLTETILYTLPIGFLSGGVLDNVVKNSTQAISDKIQQQTGIVDNSMSDLIMKVRNLAGAEVKKFEDETKKSDAVEFIKDIKDQTARYKLSHKAQVQEQLRKFIEPDTENKPAYINNLKEKLNEYVRTTTDKKEGGMLMDLMADLSKEKPNTASLIKAQKFIDNAEKTMNITPETARQEADFKTKEIGDYKLGDNTIESEADKYLDKYPDDINKATEEFVKARGIPKTVNVFVKSKFSNKTGRADFPVIRKEENITLYQGGKTGDNRQFWTSDKKYAEQFGNVKEKTGAFYKVDNGNRVTDVYVEAPPKSQLTDIIKQRAEARKTADLKLGSTELNLKAEKAVEWLNKVFPQGNIKLEISKDLKTENGFEALGMSINNLIKLVENNGQVSDKVLYHEAFHTFIRYFTTEAEYSRITDWIIKNKSGQVKTVQARYKQADVNLTADKAAEEILADDFADYVKTREAKVTPAKGLFSRLLAFLQKVLTNKPQFESLFEDVLSGKRKQIKSPKMEQLARRKPKGASWQIGDEITPKFQAELPLGEELSNEAIKDTTVQKIKSKTGKEQLAEREAKKQDREQALEKRKALIFEDEELENQYYDFKKLKVKVAEDVEQLKLKNKDATPNQIDNILYSQEKNQDEVFKMFKDRYAKEREALPQVPKETKAVVAEKARQKIYTSKDILDRRRGFIDAVKTQFGLSDNDIKSINQRDIRLMSNFEFKQFIDDLRIKADKLAGELQARNEAIDLVNQLEVDATNLIKQLKLPPISEMTKEQAEEFYSVLSQYEANDVFITPKRRKALEDTPIKDIRTWREAKEYFANLLDISVADMDTLQIKETDRMKGDVGLANKHPLFKFFVETLAANKMVRTSEFLDIKKDVIGLAKGLKTTVMQKIIPQQPIIMEYLEAENMEAKDEVAKRMIKEELDIANFMEVFYREAYDYLLKKEALKKSRFEDRYATHKQRGFLEAVKDDGWREAFKEMFTKNKLDEEGFTILDRKTGQILAYDKFFANTLYRKGGIKPTKNIIRAFLSYAQTFKTKQALDESVALIETAAEAITTRQTTKEGVVLDDKIMTFMKEWLNTKKGRHITLIAKQGGRIQRTLSAINIFFSIRDLAINVPVQIASRAGEASFNFLSLGARNYAKGIARSQTKKGKAILAKYTNFIGENPWAELVEPAREFGDRLAEGLFIGFRDATYRTNKSLLLGNLTSREYQSGEISKERLAEIRTEKGKWRVLEDGKSIWGSTPEGKQATKYKTWAIPALTTMARDLKAITVDFKSTDKAKKMEALFHFSRIAQLGGFIILLGMLIDRDDDDSFVGKLKSKFFREISSVYQTLGPKLFLSAPRLVQATVDLGVILDSLIKLEEYKTTGKDYKAGDLKGLIQFKRFFEPVMIKQLEGQKTTTTTGTSKLKPSKPQEPSKPKKPAKPKRPSR